MRPALLITAFAAAFTMACSAGSLTSADGGFEGIVNTSSGLRLLLSDTPSNSTAPKPKPEVTVEQSTIVVTGVRYGSLCLYEVTGSVNATSSTVELRVKYSQRLALCTGEIRELKYRAEISGLSKRTYDVRVIHEENGSSETVTTQTVTLQ
jgi:hypothetical protein